MLGGQQPDERVQQCSTRSLAPDLLLLHAQASLVQDNNAS